LENIKTIQKGINCTEAGQTIRSKAVKWF